MQSVLEELRFPCLDQTEEFLYPDVLVEGLHKFSNLHTLQMCGLSVSSLERLGNMLGAQLQSISIPVSPCIDDAAVIRLVAQCPKLEYLDLGFCAVSEKTAQALRSKIKTVRSTTNPADYTIDLAVEGDFVSVEVKLKDWKEPLNSNYLSRGS
jgi:Leucine-rich repeat (LRR) protein